MWFKKKSVLQAEGHYRTDKSADNTTDLRTTYKFYENTNSSITTSGRPSAADAGNYLYLPALGWYSNGTLSEISYHGGFYWSSSANPWNRYEAYGLAFYDGGVQMGNAVREYGYRVDGFE